MNDNSTNNTHYVACDAICGSGFDSNRTLCKSCEFYNEGFDKYGKTKSMMDYQVEALVDSGKCIAEQIKKDGE